MTIPSAPKSDAIAPTTFSPQPGVVGATSFDLEPRALFFALAAFTSPFAIAGFAITVWLLWN